MSTMMTTRPGQIAGLLCAVLLALPLAARAQDNRAYRQGRGGGDAAPTNMRAMRLLRRAKDYLMAGETEQGTKMLERIIDQNPDDPVRFRAWVVMGKHYMDAQRPNDAIHALSHVRKMRQGKEELKGDQLDVYLEGMYSLGKAYYEARKFTAAFPVLRMITRDFPTTVWANQSYYFIGMCHFEMENWSKCIKALERVGTSVDADEEHIRYVEAGHRFYVKITDADLPIRVRLNEPVEVGLTTEPGGDRETVSCVKLSRKGDIFIGSIPTKVGHVTETRVGDGTLQVLGGDEIRAVYTDNNTFKGQHNVDRFAKTLVVSTGQVRFAHANYKDKSNAAYINQPTTIVVEDADLDEGAEAETCRVKVESRYRREERDNVGSPSTTGIDIESLLRGNAEEDHWIVRDSVWLTLTELPESKDAEAIRSGRFGGQVDVIGAIEGTEVNQEDDKLACVIGDEIQVTYLDTLHIDGKKDRPITNKLKVAGRVTSHATADQQVIRENLTLAKKNLVEAKALLELARIFNDMGLVKGARSNGDQGIGKLDEVLAIKTPLPPEKLQKAYQLKWEIQMVLKRYGAAINTCEVFNRKYPQSPLVDRALKQIAMVHFEQKNYEQASDIFRRILNLPSSQIKAEAQFRLAECVEKQAAANPGRDDANPLAKAIPLYEACSNRYPNSDFAGDALGKQVDFLYDNKQYVNADELLERIFDEHPDEDFLPRMLLKWVLVAYRMGNIQKAYDKCSALLFQYPGTAYAKKAKAILPKLEKKLKASKTAAADAGA